MATHVKVIAATFLVVGVVCALLTLLAPAILTGLAGMISTSGDSDAAVGATILGLAGLWASLFFGTLAVAFLVTGWGLFKLKEWARIAGIIMAAICLPKFPVGTAFGIYALIILFKKDTEALFARRASPVST